jgi:hypothetical protein
VGRKIETSSGVRNWRGIKVPMPKREEENSFYKRKLPS